MSRASKIGQLIVGRLTQELAALIAPGDVSFNCGHLRVAQSPLAECRKFLRQGMLLLSSRHDQFLLETGGNENSTRKSIRCQSRCAVLRCHSQTTSFNPFPQPDHRDSLAPGALAKNEIALADGPQSTYTAHRSSRHG